MLKISEKGYLDLIIFQDKFLIILFTEKLFKGTERTLNIPKKKKHQQPLERFYCRTAFGIEDSDGDEQQPIRRKSRYGNPTDNFGQPANGGLSNIDQRQLNRVYCESRRDRVAHDELTQTIRRTIQEYPALTVAEFGPILTDKFRKIYRNFFYLVHVWHSGFQQAAVSYNGHCVTVNDQGKRHVIICYTRRGSLAWPRGSHTSTRLKPILCLFIKVINIIY